MVKIQWKKSERLVPYQEALRFMEERVAAIIANEADNLIWFLEHPDVYTGGTSASPEELLDQTRFPVYLIGRGGKYTYHGPGQRVIYFILDLNQIFNELDLRKYIYLLEEIIIQSLAKLNIIGFRRLGMIGIWVKENNEEKKIAAIGVRVRKGVSYHGIAINLNPDLTNFAGIIPCGIKEYGVTSITNLGIKTTLQALDHILEERIKKIIGLK